MDVDNRFDRYIDFIGFKFVTFEINT
jgi:hypothetical protein